MMVSPPLLKALAVATTYGGLLWTGYQRRCPFWTRRSWHRFLLAFLASFSALALSMGMASGLDHGVDQGLSPAARKASLYTMVALLLGGSGGGSGLMLWFAKGNPQRQFGPQRSGTA
jgi:hypothetical protein